ncbi:MAG: FdrA family protein, partial [Antricoccus sp.]
MTDYVELRSGIYRDSVTLMQISKRVTAVTGVETAIIAMATELNLDLAREMGFGGIGEAKPNQLLVAIRGVDSALEEAQGELEAALTEAAPSTARGATVVAPRTVAAAIGREPDSNLVLLSIPGDNVMPEALDAIDSGRSVMIFSDNVPIEQEIILKDRGRDAGVLVMGPDCGTAIVGGVALGFANTVRTGDVGIVAASGTGAQQISCLLDWAGYGVSHLLGVGGRDLSEQVAARSTLQALTALAQDSATEHIIIVSKPTIDPVRQILTDAADDVTSRTRKSVTFCVLGDGKPTMTEAVESFVTARG